MCVLWLCVRIAIKRESAVSKEVMRDLNDSSAGKKMTKTEKDAQ